MATKNIAPRANNEGGIGTAAKQWLTGRFKNLFKDGKEVAALDSPVFTGTPEAPTVGDTSDDTTKIASTAFVQSIKSLLLSRDDVEFADSSILINAYYSSGTYKSRSDGYCFRILFSGGTVAFYRFFSAGANVTITWTRAQLSGSSLYLDGSLPIFFAHASGASSARTALGLGSGATLDVPAFGNAASGELVKGDDTRLAGKTDEDIQDAIGVILDNGSSGDVHFTYDDVTPKISGAVKIDSNPSAGYGRLARTGSGLSVALGTSESDACAGNDERLDDTYRATSALQSLATVGTITWDRNTDGHYKHASITGGAVHTVAAITNAVQGFYMLSVISTVSCTLNFNGKYIDRFGALGKVPITAGNYLFLVHIRDIDLNYHVVMQRDSNRAFLGTGNPTANDDNAGTSGNGAFRVGDIWVNDSTYAISKCTDDSEGAAAWSAASVPWQAGDAMLTALASLTTAANQILTFNGADTPVATAVAANRFLARASTGNLEAKTITDFALGLLDDADAATARATLAIPVELPIFVGDETTDLTTGTAKVTFRMPFAMTVTQVRASVNTAPVGANIAVDVNEGGVSIFSTVLSIDDGEKTSETATTPAVISDSSIADDAEITVDIDQIGVGTAGKGLKLWLIGTRT